MTAGSWSARAGAVAAVLALAGGCAGGGGGPTSTVSAVDVSTRSCAHGWTPPPAGAATLTLHNVGGPPVRAQLVSGNSDAVYADTAPIVGGQSRLVRVVLPAGPVQWRCLSAGNHAVGSRVEQVTGRTTLSPQSVDPLTPDEGDFVVLGERGAVERGLQTTVTAARSLAAAVDGRAPLAVERRRWLAAHLDWVRLGGAYGAFGSLGRAIDGSAAGLEDGAADPAFTGFGRLERDFWHGARRPAERHDVTVLVTDLHRLQRRFPGLPLPVTEVTTRCHEILEDAALDELTGLDDEGSHSELATTWADVAATQQLVTLLQPVLQSRAPDLPRTLATELAALRRRLVALRRPDGTWTAPSQLTGRERATIDAAVQVALESLARVPELLPPSSGRG